MSHKHVPITDSAMQLPASRWFVAHHFTADQTLSFDAGFFIIWAISKLYYRSRWVSADKMDFFTGLDIVEAATYDEPPPKNLGEKIWK